jgi:hypothetical protein
MRNPPLQPNNPPTLRTNLVLVLRLLGRIYIEGQVNL